MKTFEELLEIPTHHEENKGNILKTIKKSIFQYFNNEKIYVVSETEKQIDFMFKNYLCYISDNIGEFRFGIINIVDSHFDIPYDLSDCRLYHEIELEYIVSKMVIKFLSIMIDRHDIHDKKEEVFIQETSFELEKDFREMIVKKKLLEAL